MNNGWNVLALVAILAWPGMVLASDTLRVGNQVLTTGDSAARVTELLGKPSHRGRVRRAHGGARRRGGVRVISGDEAGERWQYRRGDHLTTVTIVGGRVRDIQDRRS